MADDNDVRDAPGPGELFAPTGPRRSSFTPAPNDAETLEAAANLFNDDAIAEALAAELARVASGPIPIQRPPVEEPAPVEGPIIQVGPQPIQAAEQPAAPVVPEPAPEPAQEPAAPFAPEPAPVVATEPEAVSEPIPAPQPEATIPQPPVQAGPPDWATPLFGQPQQAERAEPVPPLSDPFAPSAPSFAPSNGPFPPPGDSSPEPASVPFPTEDPDALRALYSAAPAPTVPAADAPPPPGYAAPGATEQPSVGSPGEPSDLRPRRRPLDDDGFVNRGGVDELQAQLDQRDREAREYAAWESSMRAMGTPDSLAAVEQARAARTGVPLTPPPPAAPRAEEPMPFLPPPAEEPVAFLPPPTEEPAAFLPPPVEEPASFLPAPTEESGPDRGLPTGEPANYFVFPVDEPVSGPPAATDNPFDIFSASLDHPADVVPPPNNQATPFPGFTPPTDAMVTDFAAPSDPRELTFEAPPAAESPVFLAPAAAVSVPSVPSGPPSWDLTEPAPYPPVPLPSIVEPTPDERAAAEPTPEELAAAGSPPPLVAPPAEDGVADLWRAASEHPEPAPLPIPDAPVAMAPDAELPPSPDASAPPPPPPTGVTHGFEDLLSGSSSPDPQPPGPAWTAVEPSPLAEPASDAATGDRRPFGEGVERDEAVGPSDSIFGAQHAPVSLNAAGVAVAPDYVVVESSPISVLTQENVAAPAALVAPTISPAEPVGLEPTPVEQRAGRAARLFWLWFAANSSIAAIVFGTIVFALGVSLRQAIVATLAGVALSFLPLGLGTLAGKRSGQPTMVISRATFGVVGNILPSLIALFSRVFWAAALLWVLGAGTADILTGAKLTDGFTTGQLTIIAMAIGFVIAVVLAYSGYALIATVQLVISVISGIAIAGFIGLTLQYVNFTTALSTPDGPWILVISGAVLVFSFVGLAWANSSSDVARYQRPESSGAASMLWATFGVALPSFVLIAYGALLAASNATLAANIAADPLDSIGRLLPVWYPGPLVASTALSLLSGVVLAIYSGGFALQAAGLRLRRSLSTLIIGVLVLLIAIILANALTDFSQLFRDFATTVAVPVAAWAGIFGAEIMIRKRRFDSHSLLNRGGVYADVRWGNLVALVVISAIGYGFLSATMPGLTWEGYLLTIVGVPTHSQLATSDFGVLVALALGVLVPLIVGHSGIRAQEKATRVPE